MRFLAVLNRGGGTLRTMDVDAFADSLCRTIETAGHSIRFHVAAGDEIEPALDEAAAAADIDVVMIAGGDGSVSAAAGKLMNSDKVLAVLPAGTMNLFARSLGIPLNLDAAVEALASGELRRVDMALANDRPFVHQFSLGMHSELIKRRETLSYSSRLGKIRASIVAALAIIANPPRLRVRLTLPALQVDVKASSLSVSNNPFDGTHLPVAASLDRGELGIYLTRAHRGGELLRLFVSIATGTWRQSPAVEIHRADRVEILLLEPAGRFRCAVDGELLPIERRTLIVSKPGALKVLVPRGQGRPEG